MAADALPEAFKKSVSFQDVWHKIGGDHKTLPEIEKSLEERIDLLGDIASKLERVGDNAAALARREREAHIHTKYGLRGTAYPGNEEYLKVWNAANAKGRETANLKPRQEPALSQEAAKKAEYERLVENLKESWGEKTQVSEALQGHAYSGYIGIAFNGGDTYVAQIISMGKDDSGQHASHFVIHDLEKAPELGYQTLAHPGEPMIVTYDENGQCASTHVPYERFKELHAQARENPREAEEVYRQAQKEELPLTPAAEKSDLALLARLVEDVEEDKLASGKDIEVIEAEKGKTYIGYISDYGKGHAVQTLDENAFLRVVHDFDKAPELKRHAYFPGTVCVSYDQDGKGEVILGQEAIAARQAREEQTQAHEEREAAAEPRGMASNSAAGFHLTRTEHLDLTMKGYLTVTDNGGNRLDVIAGRDGRFFFEPGKQTALGYTGDEARYFKTEEAAVTYAQNWIKGRIRRVNEDYELPENRSVEGRHELVERLEKTPPQEWTERDYRRLLDVRNNSSNFPMTLGLSPEETARQSELFNVDVYFDPEVVTTWPNKDLAKRAEALENEINEIDKSWDEGKFPTETEQEAARQAMDKLSERIDVLAQEAERDNERLKAESEKIADKAYKRVEELAMNENAPELEDEMEEEFEVEENEPGVKKEDNFYELPENRSVEGRYELLERLEKTPSPEWTERDLRRLRDIQEKMTPEVPTTWGLSPEETARRDAVAYLDKEEVDTRLEAENEKVYSEARDKVDAMVSEAREVAETASLEEVSPKQKPRVSLVGQDGNVFNLLSVCVTALKQAGQKAEAEELSKRAFTCGSFDNAVSLMMEYVEEESLSPASRSNAAISGQSRAKQAMEAREAEAQAQRAEEVVARVASTPRGVESSLPFSIDKARAEVRDMRAAAAEKETAIASPTPLSVNEGAKETKETHVDSHARGAGIGTEKIIEIHEFLRKCDSAEEAKKYLSEQKLTVPDLKKVAKHDGLSYPLDRKKEDIIDSIARDTVGFRLQNASIVNYRNDEDTAKNAARQEMGTQSFIIKASHATPGTRNGKVVAVVENDSNILFVQQLAGDKSLGVMYRMDLEDIPPGLNITLGANLSITKDRGGDITVKVLEERGSTEKARGIEEKELAR